MTEQATEMPDHAIVHGSRDASSQHQVQPGGDYRDSASQTVRMQTIEPPPPTEVTQPPGLWSRVWSALRRYPLPLISLALMVISGVLWVSGARDFAQWPLIIILIVGGLPLLWETLNEIVRGEFSVDFIAILAITGSLALGEYLAGAVIVLMLSGGEALEAYALRRARSSLSSLAERAPRFAHVREGAQLVTVSADSVEVGMVVVVKPGEIIPVDGVVAQGSSNASEADLTGEPLPVRKEIGSLTLSGSVNLDGVLDVRATRRSAESQYAQIVRLVEEAQRAKAPIHRLADRYAVLFTGLTLVMAAAAWVITGGPTAALAVLVVATPCPLILATPIAVMSGIDLAARRGIIVKSGATMEQLGEVDVAVFDKTGTLTLGMPQLQEIVVLPHELGGSEVVWDERDVLSFVASLEQYSAHTLARTVVDTARSSGVTLLPVTQVEESPGKGLRGVIEQDMASGATQVAVGNRTFMGYLDLVIPVRLAEERERRTEAGQIVSFIALDGKVTALLVLADSPRPELATLAPRLMTEGIKYTVLLTGDGETVARQVGALAGVDDVVARCLPEDKSNIIGRLQAEGRKTLMVGDGVNDAPALALATVGMAVGAQGLTASAAVADAILLSGDVTRVADAVHLGKRVLRIAKQGIWIGMGLSFVAMVVAMFGYLPPTVGALLQEGIDVLVILNALRVGYGQRAPRRVIGS